jgi:hypothetical protein
MYNATEALGWMAGAFYVLVALSIVYLFFFKIVPLVFNKGSWDVWGIIRNVIVLGVVAFLLGCVAIYTADWIFSRVFDTLPSTRMAREVDRITGSLIRFSVDTHDPSLASAGSFFGPEYTLPPAGGTPSAVPLAGVMPGAPTTQQPDVQLKANALELWASLVQTKYNPTGNISDNTLVINKRDIPQGVTCDVASVGSGWALKRFEEWRLVCSMDNFQTSVVIQVNGIAARGLTGGSYYSAENPFTVYGTGSWPDICYEPIPESSLPAESTPASSEPEGGPSAEAMAAREHRVRAGESLAMIAQTYHVTVPTLVKLNQQKYPQLQSNPNVIVVGWVLALPEQQ